MSPPGPAPLRYRDPVFSNVNVTSNITYGTAVDQAGNTDTLQLDMYAPKGDTDTSPPAIVWVHGGSFCCGDKTSPELVDEATTFAKEGYVNVSINYRLCPGGCSAGGVTAGCVEAIIQATYDAQAAVRWLRANATTYGIDPTRIAIGGSSAGAITAMNVAFASTQFDTTGSNQGYSSAVGAAVRLGRTSVRHHRREATRHARFPRHRRPARAVPVGGDHAEGRVGGRPAVVPRHLARRRSRALRGAPRRDPALRVELPLLGARPRQRRYTVDGATEPNAARTHPGNEHTIEGSFGLRIVTPSTRSTAS